MKDEIYNLISSHNNLIDGIYIPHDLDVYVEKLVNKAIILTYHDACELKGFVAFYANNPNGEAFLSMILVHKNSQGNNIGKLLLESSIMVLRNKNILNYSLEVLKQNLKAIELYKNFGFQIEEDKENFWRMKLILNDN
ncbi:MAG: GNAT family N-acetyltransferase [Bacteroidetes bacterium]|nr:GNAT family N-acetyltransferase [Bacteroidota bacterium]